MYLEVKALEKGRMWEIVGAPEVKYHGFFRINARKKSVAIRVILTAGSHLYQTEARWLYAITQGINHGVEPSSPFVML